MLKMRFKPCKNYSFLLGLIALSLLFQLSVNAQESGLIKTDEGVIHYLKYGSGEPILIINGGPGLDCAGFVPLAELLSDRYTAILYDQRGTGESKLAEVDSNSVTMDLMARDIEMIRKSLKIDRWVVLGHSFGGFMAEYYAVMYPEAIKSLILSSTGGIDLSILDYFNDNLQIRLSQDERDSLKFWSDRVNNGDTSYTARYSKAKFLASAYLYNKAFVPQLARRLASGGNPQITALVYKDLFKIKFNCRAGLKDFAKPVLIIQGRQDITGDGVAYEAQRVLKNSSLVFINKSGHYSWWEQSERYKAEVIRFISASDHY